MSSEYFYYQRFPEIRVIAFHAMGPNAREDANQLMLDWFLQQQLPDGHIPRIFGYSKRNPKTGRNDYGHEMAVLLPDNRDYKPAPSVRTIPACDYLCVSAEQPPLDFVRENIKKGPYYQYANNQWTQVGPPKGFLNRQWMMEQHVVPESVEQYLRTSLIPFEYSQYTMMVPVGR